MYDFISAIRYYEKLVDYSETVSTETPEGILVQIADLHRAAGNTNIALEYYRRVLQAGDEKIKAAAHSGLGQTYTTIGQSNDAVENFRKAMQYMQKESTEYK